MKNPFTSVRLFYKETLVELKKASWPTKTELRDSTIVVLLATAILRLVYCARRFLADEWCRVADLVGAVAGLLGHPSPKAVLIFLRARRKYV